MQINKTTRILTDSYKLFNDDAYDIVTEIENSNMQIDHIITDPLITSLKIIIFDHENPRKGVDFGDWDKEFDLYGWIKPYTDLLSKMDQ